MVEAELLEPVGERRARYYLGASALTEMWAAIRAERPAQAADDPFRIIQDRRQLKLA